MRRFLIPVILALGLLTGCLGLGEQSSPREKLFVAEVTFEASLRQVKYLVATGFIRKDSPTATTIATAIREVRALLDQWQHEPDNPSYAVLVAGATARLTTLLITLRARSGGDQGVIDPGGTDFAIKHPPKPRKPKPKLVKAWGGIQPIVRAA